MKNQWAIYAIPCAIGIWALALISDGDANNQDAADYTGSGSHFTPYTLDAYTEKYPPLTTEEAATQLNAASACHVTGKSSHGRAATSVSELNVPRDSGVPCADLVKSVVFQGYSHVEVALFDKEGQMNGGLKCEFGRSGVTSLGEYRKPFPHDKTGSIHFNNEGRIVCYQNLDVMPEF